MNEPRKCELTDEHADHVCVYHYWSIDTSRARISTPLFEGSNPKTSSLIIIIVIQQQQEYDQIDKWIIAFECVSSKYVDARAYVLTIKAM